MICLGKEPISPHNISRIISKPRTNEKHNKHFEISSVKQYYKGGVCCGYDLTGILTKGVWP